MSGLTSACCGAPMISGHTGSFVRCTDCGKPCEPPGTPAAQEVPENSLCSASADVTVIGYGVEEGATLICGLPPGHDLPHWDHWDNICWTKGKPV